MQPKGQGQDDCCSEMSTPSDFPQLQCHEQFPPSVLAELCCQDEMGTESDEDEDENDENMDSSIYSYFDKVLLNHPQMLDRMKSLEESEKPKYDYFNSDSEILPYMRKIVADWMLQVCEEQGCDEAVFPLSCGILDRVLSVCRVKKEQLQLLACVCLLLSSKTRQSSHFSLDLLAFYTDYGVSVDHIRSWEMMILSVLNWDVNVITPIDFVDVLLVQCLGVGCHGRKETKILRRHVITFIALASTEARFVSLSPSLLCGSAIHTALRGMKRDRLEIVQRLADHSAKSLEQLNTITGAIENVIAKEMAAIQQTADPQIVTTKASSSLIQGQKMGGASAGLTPTDVQEIYV